MKHHLAPAGIRRRRLDASGLRAALGARLVSIDLLPAERG
jgi:hypothetical protein